MKNSPAEKVAYRLHITLDLRNVGSVLLGWHSTKGEVCKFYCGSSRVVITAKSHCNTC